MSSADTARAQYDSDDHEGKILFFKERLYFNDLGYRQQLREKSHPVSR